MSTTLKKLILINLDQLFAGPDNFIKGYLHNEHKTAFCLLGGLDEVTRRLGLPVFAGARFDAQIHLGCIIRERGRGSIVPFNNSPSTTFEDIKSVLQEAIWRA